MARVTDMETLIRQVWSPDVRPLAEEAWRCYNAGAARACIAAAWTAVTADIITKLVRMADDGDAQAVRALGDVYERRPEVARGHLAIALATLLTHPLT